MLTRHPGHGEILRFPAMSLPIGPRYDNPYEVEVESGTLIKLYQYQTDAVTQFGQTGGLRQELDVWMPQLPLPIRLHECRWQGEAAKYRVEPHRAQSPAEGGKA